MNSIKRLIAILKGKSTYIDSEGHVRAAMNISEGSYIRISFEELGRIVHNTPKTEPISVIERKPNTSSVGGVKKLTQQEIEYRKDKRRQEEDEVMSRTFDDILKL